MYFCTLRSRQHFRSCRLKFWIICLILLDLLSLALSSWHKPAKYRLLCHIFLCLVWKLFKIDSALLINFRSIDPIISTYLSNQRFSNRFDNTFIFDCFIFYLLLLYLIFFNILILNPFIKFKLCFCTFNKCFSRRLRCKIMIQFLRFDFELILFELLRF